MTGFIRLIVVGSIIWGFATLPDGSNLQETADHFRDLSEQISDDQPVIQASRSEHLWQDQQRCRQNPNLSFCSEIEPPVSGPFDGLGPYSAMNGIVADPEINSLIELNARNNLIQSLNQLGMD